jgi:restriction system protein
VKLKMAENSLFAVLLRSPWWASLSVALVLSLLSGAFMPEGFKLVGALATAPFVVVSALAARRQWREPRPAAVERCLEDARALPWPALAQRLTDAFRSEGMEPADDAAPPGADLKLTRRGAVTVIGARKWKAARTGIETLRALQAAREAIDAEHAVCVALAEPTDAARDYARDHRIRLVGGRELGRMLALSEPARRR